MNHSLKYLMIFDIIVSVPCESGNYWKCDVNTCVPCPQGFYQPQWGQTSCWPCPFNTTTDSEGSTSPTECKSMLMLCYNLWKSHNWYKLNNLQYFSNINFLYFRTKVSFLYKRWSWNIRISKLSRRISCRCWMSLACKTR